MSKNIKKQKNNKNKINKRKKIIIYTSLIIIVILIIGIFLFNGKSNLHDLINSGNSQKIKIKEQDEKKLKIVDVNSNSRNIAVMINNIKTVWGYQSGIQDAYIVYEIITEGGITRLMGILKMRIPQELERFVQVVLIILIML